MIDRNKKTPLVVTAKAIAAKYINNPVIDTFGDGKEVKKIKDISVIIEEHAVYLNTDIEKVQELAAKKKHTVVVVMEKGEVVADPVESDEISEVVEEPAVIEPQKNKKSKLKL